VTDLPLSLDSSQAARVVEALARRGKVECCFINGHQLDGAMEVTLLVTAVVPDAKHRKDRK